jgi:hypothetical protein
MVHLFSGPQRRSQRCVGNTNTWEPNSVCQSIAILLEHSRLSRELHTRSCHKSWRVSIRKWAQNMMSLCQKEVLSLALKKSNFYLGLWKFGRKLLYFSKYRTIGVETLRFPILSWIWLVWRVLALEWTESFHSCFWYDNYGFRGEFPP